MPALDISRPLAPIYFADKLNASASWSMRRDVHCESRRDEAAEGEIAMTMQTTGATHPALSYTDGIAAQTTDVLLLIGRILIGWLFFKSGWDKLMNMPGFESYLTNLKVPNPGFWSWPAVAAEVLLGAALILGIATRYAALITFVYLIIATGLAHRYWSYPAAQQGGQFAHFLKNLAIMGGALILFATGAGRFSLDRSISTRV